MEKEDKRVTTSPPYPFPGTAEQPHYGQGAPGQEHFVPINPSTRIVVATTSPTPVLLSRDPVSITCPHCGQQIVTEVRYENGLATWLGIGLCCLFGCVFGCCLIPLCINGCKDANHFCPRCKAYIGTSKAL